MLTRYVHGQQGKGREGKGRYSSEDKKALLVLWSKQERERAFLSVKCFQRNKIKNVSGDWMRGLAVYSVGLDGQSGDAKPRQRCDGGGCRVLYI